MGEPEDVPDDDEDDDTVEDPRRRKRGPRALPERKRIDTWGNSGP